MELQPTQSTMAMVDPIIRKTYGDHVMAGALAQHLAEKIDAWPDIQPSYGARTREDMIMHTCWDWMTGGTTAASVARKIEEALS